MGYTPDVSMKASDGQGDRCQAAVAPNTHNTSFVAEPHMALSIMVHGGHWGLLASIFQLVHCTAGKVMHVQIAAHSSSNIPPYLHDQQAMLKQYELGRHLSTVNVCYEQIMAEQCVPGRP